MGSPQVSPSETHQFRKSRGPNPKRMPKSSNPTSMKLRQTVGNRQEKVQDIPTPPEDQNVTVVHHGASSPGSSTETAAANSPQSETQGVQNVEDVLTAASTIDQALGCLLMDTMHFVSNAFNFEAHTLSVMNGGCAYPRQGSYAGPLVIEDPLRRVNNVGRSCFRFGELQKTLGDALIALSASIVRSESHTYNLGTAIC